MKIFEIILKLAFLLGSVYSIKTETVSGEFLIIYLLICLVLGITLIFNKKQSYGFQLTKRDTVIRRIEGVLLIAFSLFTSYVQISLNFTSILLAIFLIIYTVSNYKSGKMLFPPTQWGTFFALIVYRNKNKTQFWAATITQILIIIFLLFYGFNLF